MSLPLFELNAWFAEAEGRFDLSLSHSGCEPIPASQFTSGDDLASLANMPLGYGAFDGWQDLRQQIALQYQNIDADEIQVFNGPSEVIYTFMRTELKRGDKVIVQQPLYHSLHAIARSIGCDVLEWRPRDERTHEFNVDDLATICDRSVKLIVVNFPHNPSGQTVSEDEFRRIVKTAEDHDAILFSDEAFRLLELPPHMTLPAAADIYDRAVSVSGMSKPYGLGGLRIGWTATKCEAIRNSLREYRYYSAEMTNTPCQWLAAKALRKADRIVGANRELICSNLEKLKTFVGRHSKLLTLFPPKAGTMALVAQSTSMSSFDFCRSLLQQQRVFLIPGEPLGVAGNLLRFGLGMRDFDSALSRLDTFLTEL